TRVLRHAVQIAGVRRVKGHALAIPEPEGDERLLPRADDAPAQLLVLKRAAGDLVPADAEGLGPFETLEVENRGGELDPLFVAPGLELARLLEPELHRERLRQGVGVRVRA